MKALNWKKVEKFVKSKNLKFDVDISYWGAFAYILDRNNKRIGVTFHHMEYFYGYAKFYPLEQCLPKPINSFKEFKQIIEKITQN